MLYLDFKEKLEKLGFVVRNDFFYQKIYISLENEEKIVWIDDNKQYDVNINFPQDEPLDPKLANDLFNLVVEYVNTQPNKRYEDKKYNVVAFRVNVGKLGYMDEYTNYFYRDDEGALCIGNEFGNDNENQQWDLPDMYRYGILDYERIEVKGD